MQAVQLGLAVFLDEQVRFGLVPPELGRLDVRCDHAVHRLSPRRQRGGRFREVPFSQIGRPQTVPAGRRGMNPSGVAVMPFAY